MVCCLASSYFIYSKSYLFSRSLTFTPICWILYLRRTNKNLGHSFCNHFKWFTGNRTAIFGCPLPEFTIKCVKCIDNKICWKIFITHFENIFENALILVLLKKKIYQSGWFGPKFNGLWIFFFKSRHFVLKCVATMPKQFLCSVLVSGQRISSSTIQRKQPLSCNPNH